MKRLLGVGLALLLAGCVTTGDSDNSEAAYPISDAEYNLYTSRIGKTYWLTKYAYLVACPGRNWSYLCSDPIHLYMNSGAIKFESMEVVKKKYSYYITFNGGSAWLSADKVSDYQLLDKPRNEKHVGGPVKVGMTHQQVIDSDLGLPDDIKTWTGKNHVLEHWFYGGSDNKVIFFENGNVTVIKQN